MVNLPSSGTLLGDPSNMVDPHKIGAVLWARDRGLMVPLDLHGRIQESDARAVDHVFYRLQTFRKVVPALEVVQKTLWIDKKLVWPYLRLSMEGRSEARSLKMSGDWDEFWNLSD